MLKVLLMLGMSSQTVWAEQCGGFEDDVIAIGLPVLRGAAVAVLDENDIFSGCVIKLSFSEVEFGDERIRVLAEDTFEYRGLSSFYGGTRLVSISSSNEINFPSEQDVLAVDGLAWFGWQGRYNSALLSMAGAEYIAEGGNYLFRFPSNQGAVYLGRSVLLNDLQQQVTASRYSQLWTPLDLLAGFVDGSLVSLETRLGGQFGLAIIVMSLLIRLMFWPLNQRVLRYQLEADRNKSFLKPKLDEIKRLHTGEDAHHKIMAAHHDLGISPFYGLKPMAGMLVLIPVLLSVFNALGEMPQLAGQSFLWIEDLSRPDTVSGRDSFLSFVGGLNLLPLIMLAISLCGAVFYSSEVLSGKQLTNKKCVLALIALVIFILFYTFPSAMVLYWSATIFFQLCEQRLFARRSSR
jgi:YidC/Oxa1 family membrane protein insertase